MPNSAVKQDAPTLEPSRSRRPARLTIPKLLRLWQITWCLVPQVALVCIFGLTLSASTAGVHAQTLRASITVTSLEPARIRIDAALTSPTNRLSFPNLYAGILGLAERIERLESSDAAGRTIPLQKLGPGEFQAVEKFTRINYLVNLSPTGKPAQLSHISWLTRDQGLLMLADLLPSGFSNVSIQLDTPAGWTVAGNVKDEGAQRYATAEATTAVFLIGPALRTKSGRNGAGAFSIATSGEWPFSNNGAGKIAAKILAEYTKVTGFKLRNDALVMLIPFPNEAGPERWTAETRGNTVVILIGRRASGDRVLRTLSFVLAHELFHLWVPNSLDFAGDYDWFFEGFTLYQALRLDLRLGYITFDEYLNTLARVYDSYSAAADGGTLSLIEASQRRWTTSSSVVYDKGMLTAFVYELMLLNASDCKASLADVYRELFRRHATGQGSANDTIISVLEAREGLESFGRNYVSKSGKTALGSALSLYGLSFEQRPQGGSALVASDASKRKLLRCLRNQP